MDDKPDVILFGIAFVYGLVVPAGVIYLMRYVSDVFSASPSLSFVLPVAWFALVTLGVVFLGRSLQLPTDSLLGGGILGTVAGFGLFDVLVGWSFVMFAIALIAILAVILGSWIAYEWNRRSRDIAEPPYVTWHHIFVLVAIPPIVIGFLLLVT
ncbi:hypothetical protein [Natronosalvus halobius]|uniref:hypothetical protein n=1 Tax=Natronosalvus halobius TaxID=2953746 RepID=UPI0020A13441|nr:hypothetical protein [Natronosalvus halobius]USZ70959.1 hypothetical protein NGM15_12775 [Natronosalvus halobius]